MEAEREGGRRKSRVEHENKMKSANMLLLKQKENEAETIGKRGQECWAKSQKHF